MDKRTLNKDSLKKMILYWIECNHIEKSLCELIQDADEIAELYEFTDWRLGTSKDISVMAILNFLDEAEKTGFALTEYLNEKMPEVLLWCREHLPEVFNGYAARISDEIVFSVAKNLLEPDVLDTIYDYNTESQFSRFCLVVSQLCREALGEN